MFTLTRTHSDIPARPQCDRKRKKLSSDWAGANFKRRVADGRRSKGAAWRDGGAISLAGLVNVERRVGDFDRKKPEARHTPLYNKSLTSHSLKRQLKTHQRPASEQTAKQHFQPRKHQREDLLELDGNRHQPYSETKTAGGRVYASPMLGWDQLPLFAGSGDSQPNKQQVCRANRAFDEQRGETLYGAIHEIHRYLGKIQPLLFGSQQLSFPSASPSASKEFGLAVVGSKRRTSIVCISEAWYGTSTSPVLSHRTSLTVPRSPVRQATRFSLLNSQNATASSAPDNRFKLGRVFYVDFWHFTDPWLIILDQQIDDQIAVPPSLDKWGSLRDTFAPFMGDKNLLPMEGKMWKHLRSLFNPGFSASNMLTHVPTIERETQQLCANLQERAAKGEAFQMEPLTTNLTVQRSGDSMSAQAQGADYTAILRAKPRTKYVIDLALDAISSIADSKSSPLDHAVLENLSSQTRQFLFAGHDTTSTPLCHGPHRDPRYFPDPHSFRPERWSEGAIAGDKSREKESEVEDPLSPPERSHPHVCRPFEVGHRACIGQDLALVEMKIVLALTMRRFDITACYGPEGESEDKAVMDKY
ncbi:cytochrome P450 [Phyllosticta citriasiana]|uniref:cytochrome P450 n=1 Tax=Phyllosticta citriasiana TaxID=595635 RepID=UPI0030FDF664